MFIDEIKIYARAGHGGKGCIAFQREAYRPKGGPSGGNGGRGGSVILQADHDLNNLIGQYFQPRLIAQNGEGGKGKGMDGHAGEDIIVKVPCGTLVWQLPSSEPLDPIEPPGPDPESAHPDDPDHKIIPFASAQRPVIRCAGNQRAIEYDPAADDEMSGSQRLAWSRHNKGELVVDLTTDGQQFILCQGGRGGLGNRNFATSVRQAPRFAQPGEAGGEGEYLFELRMMAEVGLVGYPNAGKSTLLSALSAARPKIAPYPFTTLHPQIGVVEFPDWRRLVLCDVPGIIEGAHNNVGLGHAFLRHIQRCKILVLLVDMAGTDGRAPWDDYKQLRSELDLYDTALLKKPCVVVANKMDEPQASINLTKFKRRITKTPVLPISAAFDDGLDAFRKLVRQTVERVEQSPPQA